MSVHDLTFIRFPELCTADTLAYPPLIRRALRRGRHASTPAREFVADEIVEAFDVSPDRVVVVPYGATAAAARRDRHRRGHRARGWPAATASCWPWARSSRARTCPSLVAAFDAVAAHRPRPGAGARRARRVGRRRAGRGHRRQPAPVPDPPARAGSTTTSGPPCCGAPASTPTRRSTRASACPRSRPWPPARRWSPPRPARCPRWWATPPWWWPPATPTRLADALARLLDDPAPGRRRQRAAGLGSQPRFSWDATADGLVDLYRRLAALHSASI